MEPLRDPIGFGEAPHAHDGFNPGSQGCRQRFGRALSELLEQGQQLGQQLASLLGIDCFDQQQSHEPLLGLIQGLQHRPLGQIGLQGQLLFGVELPMMAAHEAEQAPVLSAFWVLLLPQFEEVVVDQAHDVEAVGHDLGIGEEFAHEVAVSLR